MNTHELGIILIFLGGVGLGGLLMQSYNIWKLRQNAIQDYNILTISEVLEELSTRSCIGKAIEEINKENGDGWLLQSIIESLNKR